MLEYAQSMGKPTEEDEVCEEIKKKKKKNQNNRRTFSKSKNL